MTDQPTLSPASQRLLREIARYDERGGAVAKYLSRGRYHLNGGTLAFNRNSFFPLYENQLVTGWDEDDDEGPIRLTEAGAKLAAELDTRAAEKKPSPKPSADGATARRLLREIAKHDEPVVIFSDGRRPWRLGSRDGYSASIDTWVALEKAGLIHVDFGFAGGKRVSVTDAGRQRVA